MSGASGEGVVSAVAATSRVAETISEPDPEVAEREVGLPGRVLLGGALIAGSLVGWTSGYGLLWFISYGAVGAILIVRRPHNPIGWILFAMAWAHALIPVTVDATVDQFQAGPPADAAFVALASLAASAVLFQLYALLAFVFPSGGMPSGRWGTIARVALVAGFLGGAVLLVSPRINVNLPSHPNGVEVSNPFAVAPELPIWQFTSISFVFVVGLVAVAVASLVVRTRAATGIERQQLRWLSAALVLVVGTVVGGLVIVSLVPGAVEGGAFIPASVAFPTVPLAIGVAVMRYRLYEIDTIINRAIVYGLLTAILAGGSAAVIGLTQTLFVGILGAGSTVTIVITTLLVVSAFNPIKTRLEVLVDRRFKPAPDPAAVLKTFVAEVRGTHATPQAARSFRHLLDHAVREFRARSGEIRWTVPGEERALVRQGQGSGSGTSDLIVHASITTASAELRLTEIAPSRASSALEAALGAVLEETMRDPMDAAVPTGGERAGQAGGHVG